MTTITNPNTPTEYTPAGPLQPMRPLFPAAGTTNSTAMTTASAKAALAEGSHIINNASTGIATIPRSLNNYRYNSFAVNTSGATATVNVWGLVPIEYVGSDGKQAFKYQPMLLAELALTGGTKAVDSDLGSGFVWCDTITVTASYRVGSGWLTEAAGPANGIARVSYDRLCSWDIQLEVVRDSATKVQAWSSIG